MPTTYEGRLAPKGTRAEAASELRTFRVEISPTPDWDDIVEVLREQIIADDIISRWALQNHWEFSVITQVDTSRAQQFRDALRSCRHDVPGDDTTTIDFQLYDERSQSWETTPLAVNKQTYERFEDWQSSFNNRNVQSFCLDPGQLHESAVRAVAEVRPSMIGEFAPDPFLAQTLFFQVALNNKQRVMEKFNEITV